MHLLYLICNPYYAVHIILFRKKIYLSAWLHNIKIKVKMYFKNKICQIDQNLAKLFAFNLKSRPWIKIYLKIFEYSFHGVPWFLLYGLMFIYKNKESYVVLTG